VYVGTGYYPTIQEAVNYIANEDNEIVSNINVIIQSSYVSSEEVFPVTIGSGFNNTEYIITFKPETEITISDSIVTALVVFDGCKNVVFDGSINGNGEKQLTFKNESKIGNVFSFVNGTQNVVLKYLNIFGSTQSTESGLVYFGGTTSEEGNNNNTIEYCKLGCDDSTLSIFPNFIIFSQGASLNTNNHNTIKNNLFFNYKPTNSPNNYGAAVYLKSYNSDWVINSNTIQNTQNLNMSVGFNFYCIWAGTNNQNTTITDNIMGGTGSGDGQMQKFPISIDYKFKAISVNSSENSNNKISGNTIRYIDIANRPFYPYDIAFIEVLGSGKFTACTNIVDNNIIEYINMRCIKPVSSNRADIIGSAIYVNNHANNYITNNTISNITAKLSKDNNGEQVNLHGMYISNSEGHIEIDGNKISNIKVEGANNTVNLQNCVLYGLYLLNVTNVEIKNNSIWELSGSHATNTNSVKGIYQTNGANNNVVKYIVSNNMISLDPIESSQNIYGIHSNNAKAEYYFNTIHLYKNITHDKNTYCFYSEGTGTQKLKNNIFSNTITNSGPSRPKQYALYMKDNPGVFEADYNIYDSQTFGYFNNADILSFEAWQTTLGQDEHSKNFTVDFVSNTNLHLNVDSVNTDFLGTPIEGIETDIDGLQRHPDYPCIGAHEVAIYPTLPVTLSSFSAVTTGNNNVLLNWVSESETGLLGYKVLRSESNDLANAVAVSNLIPAKNQSTQTKYSYTDNSYFDNKTYFYWLQTTELDGSYDFYGPIYVTINYQDITPPLIDFKTELYPAYPNPANPSTMISFSLAERSMTEITIYNAKGQLVKKLMATELGKGHHSIRWNGEDKSGKT
ncbi:MAG TPA: FlgD immunoglobulin-like domain containing protein, partial [Candidatus Cloacimonadota bacterium]|nr:FlgD immunoglobulin-like domain containing protein [Candidatus Cloacimonadota bacterium]